MAEELSIAQTPVPRGLVLVESVGEELHSNRDSWPLPMDLADKVKGMYRLLDLVSESGSNGCGNEHPQAHYLQANHSSP